MCVIYQHRREQALRTLEHMRSSASSCSQTRTHTFLPRRTNTLAGARVPGTTKKERKKASKINFMSAEQNFNIKSPRTDAALFRRSKHLQSLLHALFDWDLAVKLLLFLLY